MVALPGVPGTAQPAIQEGRYVARVLERRLKGVSWPRFRYRDLGSMATIGRTRAVAEIFGVKVAGFPAFLIWGVVHLAYLIGWGSRVEALSRWAWALVARNRRERLISAVSIVPEETAEAELEAWRERARHATADREAPSVGR
jgi:NADH:quinone reductase (non-electrogenic)